MAVEIKSGASADIQTVDPTSKAARVTLYNADGTVMEPVATGSYLSSIEVRHTSAAAAGVTVWNFRGPPTLKAYIRRLWGTMTFDGTAVAASGTLRYGLYLGTGAASASGGAARPGQKKLSTYPTSTATDVRGDITGVGLTTAGITYVTDPIAVLGLPVISLQVAVPATSATQGVSREVDIQFKQPGEADSPLVIGPNEHLALRLQTVAAIIGLGFTGYVEWDERA